MSPFDLIKEPWNALLVHPLMAVTAVAMYYTRDFGLAVILVTILIRLLVYPLYVTQIRSQRAMQEVAPAINELKRKYGNDRQRFAEEQMKLYKERGISPLAGCFPLLLQMPILFALYAALSQLGCGLGPPSNNECPGLTHDQLEQVYGIFGFLPNPIPPDGRLDTTAHWLPWITAGLQHPDNKSIFGLFGALPLIAGIAQLVASVQALPAKPVKSDDPNQRMFQSMAYTFPIMTVLIGQNFPAGLALYWITTTMFQIVQQYFVSGWGQLPKYLPFLRGLPTPADREMRRREAATMVEARADMAALDAAAPRAVESETPRGEGRRRGRRRGRR
jgi:YidC/Oxa1 family membrane protein insertase